MPDLVGFTGPADVFAEIQWLGRALRQAGTSALLVLGHDFASMNDTRALDSCPELDVVVRGEGERALCQIAEAVEKGVGLDGTASLTVRGENGVHRRTALAAEPIELDELPAPARDDMDRVLELQMAPAMFTKRGCIYRCSFCTTGQVLKADGVRSAERSWRFKSPAKAAAEFLALALAFDLRHITVVDDMFVAKDSRSRRWAEEFAQLLIDANNKTSFMIDCRVDAIDIELFRMLRRAGLARVFVGLESGSQAALRSLRKGYKPEAVSLRMDILRQLDIDAVLGFIFLTPFDDLPGLRSSLSLLAALGQDDFQLLFQELRIYPGTVMEADLRAAGLLRGSFPDYRFAYADPGVASVAGALRDYKLQLLNLLQRSLPLSVGTRRRKAFMESVRATVSAVITEAANGASCQTLLPLVGDAVRTAESLLAAGGETKMHVAGLPAGR
jgi:radical SAM superfamily enzyme YgiQ (UPF0313 family)